MRGHTKGWKKKGWQALFFAAVCVCAVLCRTPERVQAAGATVTFGSNYYMATDNERFPVGIYIDADERIGAFRVEVSYDNRRLQYVGGGDFESDGVITLEGTGQRSQVKYMLQFQTLSGGTAKIAIQSASVSTQGEDAQELTVEELIETEVRIDGEDIVGEEEPETESELPESGYAADRRKRDLRDRRS